MMEWYFCLVWAIVIAYTLVYHCFCPCPGARRGYVPSADAISICVIADCSYSFYPATWSALVLS